MIRRRALYAPHTWYPVMEISINIKTFGNYPFVDLVGEVKVFTKYLQINNSLCSIIVHINSERFKNQNNIKEAYC